MYRHILQGVEKCRELLEDPASKAFETYENPHFTSSGVVRNKHWEMALVHLRNHKVIRSVAIRTEKKRRTKVSILTHTGADVDRVEQAMQAMNTKLRSKHYFVTHKSGDNPHYYYVHEKGTTTGNANWRNRIARLTYNATEKHFEIEAYFEHAEEVIKALFNGKTPALPVERTLFDSVTAAGVG